MSVRKRLNGATSFIANATVNSATLIPKRTSRRMSWHMRADQPGTFRIFRLDYAGAEQPISAAEVVTANTDLELSFDYTKKDCFGRYVNNNATAGTVSYFEVEEG